MQIGAPIDKTRPTRQGMSEAEDAVGSDKGLLNQGPMTW